MKKLVYLIFVLSIFSSCIKIENKSVIKPLDEDDIIALIEKDSLYEGVIKSIELMREQFDIDIVLRSKFKDISYEDYLNYRKKVADTVFINKVELKADKEFVTYADSLLVLYKDKIDSISGYWRQKAKKLSPNTYCKVSLFGIQYNTEDVTLYLKVDGKNVKSINFSFNITTQGEGAPFYYSDKIYS